MTTAPVSTAPPYCPNPGCSFHTPSTAWRYQRDGFHSRQAAPHRVQRYRCCHCRRRFSEQTFRTTYWLKRPELLEPTFHGLVSCSALRQIARAQRASPQTILLHANRLGRHCLLFHEQLRPRDGIHESAALDGFISYEYSQYHPTSYNLIAGRRSYFLYGFTVSELRRSGTMTAKQKTRRAQIENARGRPSPKAVERDCVELLGITCPGPQSLRLWTDEHKAYPRMLAWRPDLEVDHRTISSKAKRDSRNPLFTVNLLDLLIRHCGSNHKRETIAFSKRRQMAIYRLAAFLVWRNNLKWCSERKHLDTPAMRLGLLDRKLEVADVLASRLVPSRVRLPQLWQEYYFGRVTTREIPRCRAHELKYAA